MKLKREAAQVLELPTIQEVESTTTKRPQVPHILLSSINIETRVKNSSRVPFQIFDNNKTPQYHEEYEDMEVDYDDENDNQGSSKIHNFSISNTESPDDKTIKKQATKASKHPLAPSERLKKLPNAQAELLEANTCKIVVKISPPAQEISIHSNTVKLSNQNKRKRRYFLNLVYFILAGQKS